MYDQVANMATDQANFNMRIQNEQNKLQEPLEVEMTKIRQESELMMRELERTQRANREMMNNVVVSIPTERSPQTKYNSFIHPSTAVSSTRADRRANSSVNENYSKGSQRHIRYSTPNVTAVPMTRLKRFNFNNNKKKDDTLPDFSYLIKSKLQDRKNDANKSVLQISTDSQVEVPRDITEYLNRTTRGTARTADSRFRKHKFKSKSKK